jgi:hypothetical protein
MKISMVSISDPIVGDQFFCGELDNADNWPSKEATEQMFANLYAIAERGFEGIRIRLFDAGQGRTLLAPAFNCATPEGRLGQRLHALATRGHQLPTAEVISILERDYREQNLPLPPSTDKAREEDL